MLPLADILKRRTKSSVVQPDTKNLSPKHSPVKRKSFDVKLPLEEIDHANDTKNSTVLSEESRRENNPGLQLVTSLSDVLDRKVALGYFIQYLDSKQQGALIKFLLDTESFQAIAEQKLRQQQQQQDQTKVTSEKSERDVVDDDEENPFPSPESLTSSGPASATTELSDQSNANTLPPDNSTQNNQKPHGSKSLSSLTEDAVEIYQRFVKIRIMICVSLKVFSLDFRYVAPDCPYPIDIPLSEKQEIIRGICAENGQVEATCFDSAKFQVIQSIDATHYLEFLRSPFYAKHQLEVITCDGGSGVTAKGVLHNDALLFRLMEFMETIGKNERGLLEFWMAANNFKQQYVNNNNANTTENTCSGDAMLIYEKYISLQAAVPLGFNASVRSRIEEAICSENGIVSPLCFDEAMAVIEAALQQKYLFNFLASNLFSSYLAELMTTIERSGVTSTASAFNLNTSTSNRQRSASGSSLNTTCSSETMSSSMTTSISTHNTLLATASSSKKKHSKRRSKSPDFLDKSADPDHLWQRKQTVLTSIGHVDHLGRYRSSLQLPPEMQDRRNKSHVLSGFPIQAGVKAKITKAVKKMVTNDDLERFKEEMAWQMAEMIVSDVTNRTLSSGDGDDLDEDILSDIGTPNTPSSSTSAFATFKARKNSSAS